MSKQREVDYLSVRLVLVESVVPELNELHVSLPFSEDGLVAFGIRSAAASPAEDDDAEIQLNPKQVRALLSFLGSWLALGELQKGNQ